MIFKHYESDLERRQRELVAHHLDQAAMLAWGMDLGEVVEILHEKFPATSGGSHASHVRDFVDILYGVMDD